MNKILTLLFLMFSGVAFAQNTTLKFKTSKRISVQVYHPMDNYYNGYIYDRIELYPDKISEYRIDVDGFCYVKIRYSDTKLFNLIVTEGNILEVEYKDQNLLFNGVDCLANSYNKENWLGEYKQTLDNIFARNYKDQKIDIIQLTKEIEQTIFKPYYDKMKNNSFSRKISKIIKDNFWYYINGSIIMNYGSLLQGVNGTLLPQDSIAVLKQIQSILDKNSATDKDIPKYSHASVYTSAYYSTKAQYFLTATEKQNLNSRPGFKDFGPYAHFLLAPNHIQNTEFGSAVIIQYDYSANELDCEKVFEYIKKVNPQSDYIGEIEKRTREKSLQAREAKPKFLDGDIHSLKMLSERTELRDKYLLIDLWATWCLPCRTEFRYLNDLRKLLSNYNNLQTVYISIDYKDDDEKWRQDVLKCHLTGYNFRASSQLYDELKKTIYNDKDVFIPRYLLLSPEGEIIDSELPSPSNLDLLKQVLDKKIPFSTTVGNKKKTELNRS